MDVVYVQCCGHRENVVRHFVQSEKVVGDILELVVGVVVEVVVAKLVRVETDYIEPRVVGHYVSKKVVSSGEGSLAFVVEIVLG